MGRGGTLPEWRAGTVAVLGTAGAAPHAMPVSTAVRAGPRRIVLALAHARESLARLRADPRCALTVLAADVALTAHGRATIVQESLDGAEGVAAVAIDVEAIRSHADPRLRIEDGVRWRWTDADAERRDRAVHAALARLAG